MTKHATRRRRVGVLLATGLGGLATLMLPAQPAAAIHTSPDQPHAIEIEDVEVLAKGAAIAVTVEVVCPAGYSGFVGVSVTQARGRRIARGGGTTGITCTGEPQEVDVIVTAQEGAFKKGTALATAFFSACEPFPFPPPFPPFPPFPPCVSGEDIEEVSVS